MTNTQAKRPSAEELASLLWDVYHHAFHLLDDSEHGEIRAATNAEDVDKLEAAILAFESALPAAAHGEADPKSALLASLQDRPQQADRGVIDDVLHYAREVGRDGEGDADLVDYAAGWRDALSCFTRRFAESAPLLAPSPTIHTDNTETLRNALAKIEELEAKLAPLPSSDAQAVAFQDRVDPWLQQCFGKVIAADTVERNHRFIEEALELVQACGMPKADAHSLVEYVYGRPWGELSQEVGGVMVTLAALCIAQGTDMHADAEKELTRIWTKVETIRAKQAAKPRGSALPVAHPPSPDLHVALLNAAYAMESSVQYFHKPKDRTLCRKQVQLVRDHLRALSAHPPQSHDAVRALVAKWRIGDERDNCTCDRCNCRRELEQALAAMDAKEGK